VQLLGDWSEKEQLLSAAVAKDKERMEELNKALATVSKVGKFPLHVSHRLNPATYP
jgi:hypothetical protein